VDRAVPEQTMSQSPSSGTIRRIWQRHSALISLAGAIIILLVNFWAGMDAHWDYEYPLHVDEYFAMGYTDAMMDEGSLTYHDPYRDGTISKHHEMGFHLLMGSFREMTGLSWLGFYRIAPAVMLVLISFLVYALGHREGYGWAAALFVILIPTSIRTLGPAFLVPMVGAMLFIPVAILILHRIESIGTTKALLLLMVLIGVTVSFHPPTGGIVFALIALYLFALTIEGLIDRKYFRSGGVIAAIGVMLVVPLMIMLRWQYAYFDRIWEKMPNNDSGMTELLGFHSGFIEAFGIIATVLFTAGSLAFLYVRAYRLRTYVLPAYILLLFAFMYIVYPRYDLGPNILYERGWSYVGLFMAIMAGFGIARYFRSISRLNLKIRQHASPIQAVAVMAGITVLVMALTTGFFGNKRDQYAGYYYMVGDQIRSDFVWLGENTTDSHKVALMEGSLAWTYPPIAGAGNQVNGAVASPQAHKWSQEAEAAFNTGEIETEWIEKQGASVLYSRWPVSQEARNMSNNDLIQVRPGVYLVPESIDAAH